MELIKNWDNTKNLVFGEGEAELIKENDYIRVTNRTQMYSSLAVHAHEALGAKQAYKSRYLMKLPAGSEPVKMKIYHKINIDYLDVKEISYASSNEVILNDSEWKELKHASSLPVGSEIVDFIVYFIHFLNELIGICIFRGCGHFD